MRLLSESELNTIRGKVMAGHATRDEIMKVFFHIDLMETWLDEQEDGGDLNEWRDRMGIPE